MSITATINLQSHISIISDCNNSNWKKCNELTERKIENWTYLHKLLKESCSAQRMPSLQVQDCKIVSSIVNIVISIFMIDIDIIIVLS